MIFRNVNLDDPTCMQNFEFEFGQGAYALIWTIFKRDFNLNFHTQTRLII
jgi:hypothetical protein